MKRLVVWAVVIAFCLTSSLVLAKAKSKWFLIKAKDGTCRVIEAEKKTPATIGGPYKSKENAQKAKAKKCPPKKK